MRSQCISSGLFLVLALAQCTAAFAGPTNTYLDFDGADYVDIVDSDDLDLTGGSFTLSAWIRPDGWGQNDQGRVIDHGGGSSGNQGWTLQLVNSSSLGFPQTLRMQINNSNQLLMSDAGAVSLGVWQHLAVTYDAGALQIYVDGVARGAWTTVPVPVARNAPVRIGGRATDDQRGFDGAIDDVRIWDRALSQQEIQDGLGSELTGTETGLLAYLPMNENVGQLAGDLTTNGHDGILGSTTNVDTADPDWFSAGPPPNTAPVVDAGSDQVIALPIDTISLNGLVSDDGQPLGALNVSWSMLSGPGAVSFFDSTVANTTATFVTPGDYVLQLNASDTILDTSDQLLVTVYALAVLTTIDVMPDPAVLLTGDTQQFVAGGLDQTGQPYAITPTWGATGGSIDSGGFYTAGTIKGQFQATASAGSVVGQADIFLVDNPVV